MCSLWRVCNPLLLFLSFLLTEHPISVSKTAVIVLEGGKRGRKREFQPVNTQLAVPQEVEQDLDLGARPDSGSLGHLAILKVSL